MKVRTAYLFYMLALISIILAIIKWRSTFDVALHDTYFVIGCADFFIPVSVLSIFTGAVYAFMDKRGKPISKRIGLIHFVLIVVGLLLSLNIYSIFKVFIAQGTPDTIAFAGDANVFFICLCWPCIIVVKLVCICVWYF